jgi:hypothetical protein
MLTQAQIAQVDAAEERGYSCYHMSIVYNLRADQLTKWKRRLEFVSLGVAPGIILIVVERPYVREAGIVVAGICSVAAYVWAVFGYTFHWERQLEVSRKAASAMRSLFNQIRNLLPVVRDPSSSARTVQQCLKALAETEGDYEAIAKEIDESGTEVRPWMTLMAQQRTMVDLHTTCSVCNTAWDRTKDHLFSEAEAKRFCKDPSLPGCRECGLVR